MLIVLMHSGWLWFLRDFFVFVVDNVLLPFAFVCLDHIDYKKMHFMEHFTYFTTDLVLNCLICLCDRLI